METVSLDVGKLIQKGRMAKELSQKELATVSKIIFIKQMKALESNVMAYVRKR